jgi:hypothetical protein
MPSDVHDGEAGGISDTGGINTPIPYASPLTPPPSTNIGDQSAMMSLCSGVLICVPFITGALAIGFACFVLRDWGESSAKGRVNAILGLLGGVANFTFWSLVLAQG